MTRGRGGGFFFSSEQKYFSHTNGSFDGYSIPAGVIGAAGLWVFLPNGFPHQSTAFPEKMQRESTNWWRRVDFLGTAFLLMMTIFFVAALEEAGINFPWRSAFVIILLVLSGISCAVFLYWERAVTLSTSLREPVFPWRLVISRVWVGMML